MDDKESARKVILITGASRGIGRFLVDHYRERGFVVFGCSRRPAQDPPGKDYHHTCLDVADEPAVMALLSDIRKGCGRLDVLINNAGIASMNHSLLTPLRTVQSVLQTNVTGSFLFAREAAKLMRSGTGGRIVNFVSVALPYRLEGEAIYAASKAAVLSLTQILARELAAFQITVNAVGPSPVRTDLIRSVPEDKLRSLIDRQAIRRFGTYADIANVVDFFIRPESDFVTGQVIYLGGA